MLNEPLTRGSLVEVRHGRNSFLGRVRGLKGAQVYVQRVDLLGHIGPTWLVGRPHIVRVVAHREEAS